MVQSAPRKAKRAAASEKKAGRLRTDGADHRQNLDQVGPRLRAAREARGMSLREMARRINVSASFVSQVETGKASPSVGTLYSFVNQLGLSLDEVMSDDMDHASATTMVPTQSDGETSLFDVPWASLPSAAWPQIDSPLQRSVGRPTIKLAGVTWERLTREDDPLVDFLYVSYSPGSASCSEDNMMRHGGREYGYVISGHIDVQVGFEHYTLGPGDSLHFDSTILHRLSNPYDETCVALWVVVARKGDNRVTTPSGPPFNHLPGRM